MFSLDLFFDQFAYDEAKRAYFNGFKIADVAYRKSRDLLILKIENGAILPIAQYEDLCAYFDSLQLGDYRFFVRAENEELSLKDFSGYVRFFSARNNDCFKSCVVTKDENETFVFSYLDENQLNIDEGFMDDLKLFLCDIGYRKNVRQILKKAESFQVETVEAHVKPQPASPPSKPANDKPYYKPRTKNYTSIVIDDLKEDLYAVKFKAQMFKIDNRETRTGTTIQTIYVKDETNATIVKVVEGRRFTKENIKDNKEGKWANFYGNYRFDNFSGDYIFEPDQIEFTEAEVELTDDEPLKRIELHAHTNKSEMDGVCEPEELVEAAFMMGHEGIAITDHLNVQGFPGAQKMATKLLKAHPERNFKVIYGLEMNMVDSKLNIVYNPDQRALNTAEYVVFDLETTGLSTRHDYVIEFGAVLLHKGMVVERKDFFLKPPIALSDTIKNLTHISDADLADARTFAQAKDELLAFLKDRVLVAHNATFDYGFLNEELARLGLPGLNNPVIDTLDFARTLFKSRRSYRLGNIARQYNVNYDEAVAHRADYDAEVLASVFHLMLKDAARLGIETIEQLADYHSADAFIKNRAYHTNVLVKNKAGLKDLFKLVSISHTESLAVFGKANTKSADSEFIAEPRILRETLNQYRENLLVGSGCLNGEVFEIASTRNKAALAKAISFYDYIELQPLDNYRGLVERGSFSFDRLKQYQRDIIEEALAQHKLLIATGDVHYVYKDEKILRDVYINAQAIGGLHHPLYVYDKERRSKQITPDQRFLNTREMLMAFSWLNDEQLVKQMVIENPHKILNMCETIKPIYDRLFPPAIEGSNDKLEAEVYKTAHEKYGPVLDEFIDARIKREINAIFTTGYGVIYYVSHLLVKKSNSDGYLVGSRGSVGSSIVATFSGITESNPLPAHYICPKCHHLEWMKDYSSGYDLPDKKCPECGSDLIGDGQNIPFETFLGFNGDKVPDIDLNFSGDYQPNAHLFTREIFGDDHVFRAGTIGTVAEKTAFGYVSGFCEEKGITTMSRAQRQRLASGCEGVKRTTGQHPGGIIVIPSDMDVYDFTPVQYPANDPDSVWKTTHFDFHEIHDNVLKFDILGHVDPTAMRLLQDISGIDVQTIPMNDPKTMSLFYSTEALGIINPAYTEETGAAGLPEFGTRFVRGILADTHPHCFSDLVRISGLSHGTDVWNNNAKDLIDEGIAFADVIGCRDDIMLGLIAFGLPSKPSFDIMERVRKGKGLTPDDEALMNEHNVPSWYIASCKKIKYMFPKAHAVAYVIMAVRIAWFKVYFPEYYYVSYFSLRCDAYEIETMCKDCEGIAARMNELAAKISGKEASKKEKDVYDMLEVCYEMASRGYRMSNIDLKLSKATEFIVSPYDRHVLIPPFTVLDGLGGNVAESIVEAREQQDFISKEDLMRRTQLSNTLCKRLSDLGVLSGLDETNQVSLF